MAWQATDLPVFSGLSASATEDEIHEWLGSPTDATCSQCGQAHLQRFERLNGRCERCRVAYLAEVERNDDRHYAPERDCPTCDGLGWREVPRTVRYARCPCTQPADEGERVLADLRRAGVPGTYWTCTWETWSGPKPEEATRYVHAVTTSEPGTVEQQGARVLYISGRQGRGKTHLGTAVFRDLNGRGVRGE